MPYFERTKKAARKFRGNAPGLRLASLAVKLDFSVIRIAACTGATRQTVYGWFRGRTVSPVYRQRVGSLCSILEASTTAEQAWSTACTIYNLKP